MVHIDGIDGVEWRDLITQEYLRWAPLFAPLSLTFFHHLQRFAASRPDLLSQQNKPLSTLDLLSLIKARQSETFFYVNPFATTEQVLHRVKVTTGWLQSSYPLFDLYPARSATSSPRPARKKLPLQTISRWRQKNLLRFNARGEPDPNSVCDLFILRACIKGKTRQLNWLPEKKDEQEPWFWIYALQPGEKAPQIIPWPLPKGLPPHTLLWSPWPGCAWLPGWLSLGNGAISWTRTRILHQQTLWDISLKDLLAWDKHIGSYMADYPQEITESEAGEQLLMKNRHALAEVLLYNLAKRVVFPHLETLPTTPISPYYTSLPLYVSIPLNSRC